MNSNLAENLKKIRKENNLSQEDLADILGVSRQAISKWESKVSYPEMDKIVLLCKKFNLNIDDLLHRDIKEVKESMAVKSKIKSSCDEIFNFIINSFELFWQMTLKMKIKFILEQIIIVIIMLIIWNCGAYMGSFIIQQVLRKIPHDIYITIYSIFSSFYLILGLIFNIIIIFKLYKVRYYNAYVSFTNNENALESKTSLEFKDSRDINFKQNMTRSNKIVIENKNSSDDNFFDLLTNIVVGTIKLIGLGIVLFLSFTLVCIVIGLICSLLIVKSGLFFTGIFSSGLALGIITILGILLLLNFIFNRKSNFKIMIYAFLGSVILLGLGLGFVLVSLVGFSDASLSNNLKQESIEILMQDNLYLRTYDKDSISYQELDIDNIRIEYKIDKACKIENRVRSNGNLYLKPFCEDKHMIIKELIDSLNNKKIYNFGDNMHIIKDITIYGKKENLDIIRKNMEE